MSEIFSTVAPYAGSLVFGGVIGLAVGWFIKKALKIILLLAGGLFVLFIAAAYYKVIIIDWHKIQQKSNEIAQQGLTTVTNALNSTNNEMSAAGLNHIDATYPIFGVVGFLPAFAVGFMKG